MRWKQLIALALVMMFALVPLLPNAKAASAPTYSESLVVYVAGNSALWRVTLTGVNSTTALKQADNITGVSSYTLSAVKTTAWTSDFQVFGPEGYNVLPVPFLPGQGLFLTVDAPNFKTSTSVASVFDARLGAAFISLANRTGNFLFFSPVSFDSVVPQAFFRLLPSNSSGFASLVKSSSFSSLTAPFVAVTSQKSSAGFVHSLSFGSAKAAVLDSSGSVSVLSLFNTSPSSIHAERFSNSSLVVVHALDGLVFSNDKATVTNNRGNFSGSYSYSIAPSGKVKTVNVSILENPPVLVGTRILDRGSVSAGDSLSVTLTVRNVGTTPVQNVTVNDNWWMSSKVPFMLTNGQSNFTISSLVQGNVTSRTYVLKVNTTASAELLVPALTAQYAYSFGGKSLQGSFVFNPLQILVGQVGPAVTIFAIPDSTSGKPIGVAENFVVTVANYGNSPALNLRLGSSTNPTLPQGGQTWSVTVPAVVSSLTSRNLTRTFTVSWQTPGGQTQNFTSNPVGLVFSHSAMQIGYVSATLNSTLRWLSPVSTNVTLNYLLTGVGGSAISFLSGHQNLPPSWGCGLVTGSNVTCSKGTLSFKFTPIKQQTSVKARVTYLLNQSMSVVVSPFTYTYTTSGLNFSGSSGGAGVPAGLTVSKSMSPSPVIQGMSAYVTVAASNRGPFSLYNATVYTFTDPFDSLPIPQPTTQRTYGELSSVGSQTFTFPVTINGGASGNKTFAVAGAQFLFAGTLYTITVVQRSVLVYLPVRVAMTSKPATPIEGNTFTVTISLTNPAGVDVSNVLFSVPIPPGVQVIGTTNASVLNGAITVKISNLGAHGVYKANVSLRANAGLSFGLSGGSVTFSYAGSTIKGSLGAQGTMVNEDILTRYTIPVLVAVLALLATVVVVRRRIPPSASASPQQTPQKRP